MINGNDACWCCQVNAWSGSIEIGVTALDPSVLNLPTSATGFRESTWVMSGCSVLRDGHTTIEDYGQDLDQLKEADRVGVLRTASGALHFYVNGVDQGQAAVDTPSTVYAIVDMYGKCAQVSVVDDSNRDAGRSPSVSLNRIESNSVTFCSFWFYLKF